MKETASETDFKRHQEKKGKEERQEVYRNEMQDRVKDRRCVCVMQLPPVLISSILLELREK